MPLQPPQPMHPPPMLIPPDPQDPPPPPPDDLPSMPPLPTPVAGPTPRQTANRLCAHAHSNDLPSISALVAYLLATAGFPIKSTWLLAIQRGAYYSWLGITPALVARYCPNSRETHLGHTAQPCQHIRSTTTHRNLTIGTPSATNCKIPVSRIFTDDTGRFQPQAASGNQYIMVTLHSSNAILIQPFATKKDAHRIAAYQTLHSRLHMVNQSPTIHIMDN